MAAGPSRPPRRGRLAALLLAGALLCAGLSALGLWQLRRLAWKEDLIERVAQRLAAAPVPAPGPQQWPGLEPRANEYRRVHLQGHFLPGAEVKVQASTELGSGWWVLAPLRVQPESGPAWWVLVNRGFVPPQPRGAQGRSDAAAPTGTVHLEGLLRLSEPRGRLFQQNDPAAGRWYSRDVGAIAATLGLGGPDRPGAVAPYFVDAGGNPQAPVWPRPGLTVIRFQNNHLVYALTWFALAAMVAGACIWLLADERRRTQGA